MAKKKLLVSILFVLCACVMSATLTACIDGEHTHSYTKQTVNATCTEKGLITYTCSCGDIYTEEISALGHNVVKNNGKEGVCTVCGDMFLLESGIMFKTFSVDGMTVTAKNSFSNATTEFSFADEIEIYGDVTYQVSKDKYGSQTYLTKTVPLEEGNNVYYVFVIDKDQLTMFTVTIRRRPMYTVSFNTSGGGSLQFQTVEEDCVARIPEETPTKLGYTFVGWDYDFSIFITKNTVITAKFEVKAEMLNFEFLSTYNTCTIMGIKDKTVTEIIIPDYVTSIGSYAFSSCNSLTNIEVSVDNMVYKSIDGNLYSKDGTILIQYAIGKDDIAFIIPDSTTSIGAKAFYFCDSLISVVIGDKVTSIGSMAFYGCHRLVEVVNKSTYITVTKGSVVSNGWVGYYALSVSNREENYQTKITNDNGYLIYDYGNENILVGYIGEETDLILPEYVKQINQYAFYYCDSLIGVIIGDRVTSIGEAAFYNCSGLTSIEIPNSVTSIDTYAFSRCDSLTSVVIGDGVTSIGEAAFYNCSGLTSVVIGDKVTSIGVWAFEYCGNLTSIMFEDTSTWYRTTNSTDWQNKTGGTSTDVTNDYNNVTYFKSTDYYYYWYKL